MIPHLLSTEITAIQSRIRTLAHCLQASGATKATFSLSISASFGELRITENAIMIVANGKPIGKGETLKEALAAARNQLLFERTKLKSSM